jgi:ATP-dependent exoDNAse (exonuclease V) beta subunit
MKNIEFINAGAGSGKTYFLSEKLTEVICTGECSAEEIILTTFTEVAAAELKNRAREALLKKGKMEQANLLESAAIGTVHSVALQMIQKYWLYLGVGVDLRVMPEEDKNFFFSHSLAFIPSMEELNILDRITRSLNFQTGFNQQDQDRWKRDLMEVIEKALNNRIETLAESKDNSIQELEQLFPVDPNWKIDTGLVNLILEKAKLLIFEDKPSDANEKRINAINEFLPFPEDCSLSVLLKLGNLINGFPKKFTKNLPGLENIQNSLAHIHSSPLMVNDMREYIELIFHLAERSLHKYAEYKKERKLIDYTDMEVLFLKLLENEKAKKEINSRYKMVFVDEFQDSSPIQIDIFCKLSDLMKQSYWVGDPKQAIYDFRGTDPRLIEAVIRKLSSENTENLTIGKPLSDSWRSRPQIVDFTNELFSKVLADQVDANSVALNPVRTENELPGNEWHKPVQCWNFISGKRMTNEKLSHHLAKGIADFLNRNNVYVLDKRKSKLDKLAQNQVIKTRPLNPEDVAVLWRTNPKVRSFSDSLKKFGFQVAAEQDNLTETAEFKLLLALINYYLDKNDTLAKATIKFLTENENSVTTLLDDRLDFLYGSDAPVEPLIEENENSEEWNAYYQKLNNWGATNPLLKKMDLLKENSSHLSVSNLVEKIIATTGISDFASLWNNPLQRKNNLETIKQLAKEYEERCLILDLASSLRGFMEFITNYRNQELKQGAAVGTEAVNALTYHKSKGLEWPIVILNDLDYDHLSDQNLINKGFFGVNLFSDIETNLENLFLGRTIHLLPWPFGAMNKKVPEDLTNRILKNSRFEVQQENSKRELKRLLYVGMTRARDMLILVNYTSNPLKWVKDLLDAVKINEGAGKNMFGTSHEIVEKTLDFGDDISWPELEMKNVQLLQKNGPVEQNNPLFRSPSHESSVENPVVSVVEDFQFRIQRSAGNKTDDNVLGDCLHELFYHFSEENREEFLEKGKQIISRYGLAGDLTHVEHIYQSAINLFGFLTRQYGLPAKIWKELPMQMVEDGAVYSGTADLVWETENTLILVDYKSYSGKQSHILSPDHEKFSGRYSGQLNTYSRMLNRCHPEGKKVSENLIYYAIIGMVVKVNEYLNK